MFLTMGILVISLIYVFGRVHSTVKMLDNQLNNRGVDEFDVVVFLALLWCIDKGMCIYYGIAQ